MSAEQTDKEEIWRAHVQSANLMWQADISNRLKEARQRKLLLERRKEKF